MAAILPSLASPSSFSQSSLINSPALSPFQNPFSKTLAANHFGFQQVDSSRTTFSLAVRSSSGWANSGGFERRIGIGGSQYRSPQKVREGHIVCAFGDTQKSESVSEFLKAAEEPEPGVNSEAVRGGGGGNNLGGGGGGGEGGGGGGEEEEKEKKRRMALSMSQKLTLGYAALVGVGGLMGYIKSGSNKSLVSGGLSALLLYYVHTQLPVRPAFASAVGLGVSALLLLVMGSRFKNSGKIFPAGVVSLVSLIMTGGYLHGIFRSSHA
uniref:Uncharacterized protein n=1 Tax=Picea sitchensis TaxID=3332 RepID=B8LPI2_PICSI|nr:unknown [Picea sitchensis]